MKYAFRLSVKNDYIQSFVENKCFTVYNLDSGWLNVDSGVFRLLSALYWNIWLIPHLKHFQMTDDLCFSIKVPSKI